MTLHVLTPRSPTARFRDHRRSDRGARHRVLRSAVGRHHRSAGAGGDHRRRGLRQDHGDGGPGRLAGGHRRRAARGGARPDLHPQGRRRAVAPGPHRPAPGRGDRRPRRRRIRRAVDHDLRRVRGPAGRRARSAAGVRGGPDDDHRRHPLPAGLPGGEVGRRPVRVHLPAAAGLGDRAGAQARLGPAAASGRPGPTGSPCPRPADRAGIGADEPAGECLRRHQTGHHQRPGTPRAGQSGAGLPAPEGAPRAGRVRRPDGHRGPAGHRGAAGLDRAALGLPGGVAGRVPGHLGGPGDHAPRPVLRLDTERRTRPSGDRGGRSLPGHLRLARRGREQHHLLRRRLPPGGRPPEPAASRSP